MIDCYLGLGSNLRSPSRQLRQAIASLKKLPRSTVKQYSSLYSSTPAGVHAQPNYKNMAVHLQTSLPPDRLLQVCQAIEQKHNRIRKRHWGARTLDIDVLLYGDQSIQTHDLIIPHPHLLTRDFVLLPLLELAPLASLPNGETIKDYLGCCEPHVSKVSTHC
jgi:2-amino-4-hydroxy-6-hydroxymethyldihydropteridine diphosphokinase